MVSNKAEMYRMLHRGDFGNTVPMWFDPWEWWEMIYSKIQLGHRIDGSPLHWWGVRSLTPGGPCFLNAGWWDVKNIAYNIRNLGYEINISPMIDRIVNVTMWANILRSNSGLVLECIEYPDRASNWRAEMPTKAKTYQNTAANILLRKHLNPNTLDDLEILLDKYPDAVVELSATESEFGTVLGRNAIIWEVRNY